LTRVLVMKSRNGYNNDDGKKTRSRARDVIVEKKEKSNENETRSSSKKVITSYRSTLLCVLP